MNIGIDHGYYAIKTRHCSFPAGLTAYGSHEPYTRQGLLEFGGCFFVCGTGRQPIQRDKTINDNYYLLTLAALAQEIRSRGVPTECTIRIAAGLPLTSYGRDKPKFRSYLFRPSQPVQFRYEGVEYSITIADVQLFPQGFAALMAEPDLLTDELSLLLMDIGGWTVDLMRIDNALPVAETAHSLELGMIRCIDEIRERVRQETGLSLTDAQIEQILAGQPCSLPDEVRSIVNKQGRLYTERLFSAVMEAGFDLHAMPLVMLGGGACIVAPLVGMIMLVVREADRIENQVVMNMIPVYVGGQDKLVLAAQDFPCQLHPDLMGLLRRHLSGLKGLYEVAAQVRALVDGLAAGPGKFNVRSLGGAAIGGYQQFSICFLRVADIVYRRFQR